MSDQDLEGAAVLDRTDLGPCLRGPGDARLWCGNCGVLLVEGVEPRRVAELVFRCECGAYNRPILDPTRPRGRHAHVPL